MRTKAERINASAQVGRAGLSFLEIMVGSLILALGLLPILQSMGETGRQAGFSRGHLLAHARVQALLDAQESLGWETVAVAEERSLSIPSEAGSPPDLFGVKDGKSYQERLTVVPVSDGLVALRAEVSWALPSDPGSGRPSHVARSIRMISRPDQSWLATITLPARTETAD